jgi:pentatricopeptide repeat protein
MLLHSGSELCLLGVKDTFNILIKAAYDTKQLDQGLDILKEMQSRFIDLDVIQTGRLMNLFGFYKKVKEAQELFEDTLKNQHSLKKQHQLKCSLLQVYCANQEVEKAQKLFKEIENSGYKLLNCVAQSMKQMSETSNVSVH